MCIRDRVIPVDVALGNVVRQIVLELPEIRHEARKALALQGGIYLARLELRELAQECGGLAHARRLLAGLLAIGFAGFLAQALGLEDRLRFGRRMHPVQGRVVPFPNLCEHGVGFPAGERRIAVHGLEVVCLLYTSRCV